MRAIVTRPAAQAESWVRALCATGVDAVSLPLIEIAPLSDPVPLDEAWAALDRDALVFFVSPNAVQHFFARRPAGVAWPQHTLAAAPGPGSAQSLREHGVPGALVMEPAADSPSFDSEALWRVLSGRDWRGRRVLVVRGEDGRDWLVEQLRSAGAEPRYLAAYRRRAPRPDPAGLRLLADATAAPRDHLWLFSSSEAVRHLASMWPVPPGARALASHPRIAAAAQQAGFAEVGELPTVLAQASQVVARAAGTAPGAPGREAGRPIQSGPS